MMCVILMYIEILEQLSYLMLHLFLLKISFLNYMADAMSSILSVVCLQVGIRNVRSYLVLTLECLVIIKREKGRLK